MVPTFRIQLFSKENFIAALRWVCITSLLVAVIIYVETNLLSVAIVRGNSMYPTMKEGDVLLTSRINVIPESGEIVLIKTPDTYHESECIVKRVIATGGETITIDYDQNLVSVDGKPLQELYINLENEDPMQNDELISVDYVVPDGYIFVMGDNRNFSVDSRSENISFIPEKDIIGKVILRI